MRMNRHYQQTNSIIIPYIIYKIKVMFYKIGTSGKHPFYSPVDKCDVPCLSGNVSVFAFRIYNLERKLKTQDKNTQISVYCIQHYCL